MREYAQPITLKAAAEHFGRSWTSVRDWPARYNARRLTTPQVLGSRRVYYDLVDLSTIDAHLHMGKRVPKTPELRDEYRERLRATAA
ncbi:hypothetical protein ACIBQ1_09790 [Nonomuraea sp. NPDC050153]|uniref:hypothetical protein n=1 Tax=Nonomuraea sp. NPDC050153 TaxID=3364359 RepID=UPI0037A5BA84